MRNISLFPEILGIVQSRFFLIKYGLTKFFIARLLKFRKLGY